MHQLVNVMGDVNTSTKKELSSYRQGFSVFWRHLRFKYQDVTQNPKNISLKLQHETDIRLNASPQEKHWERIWL